MKMATASAADAFRTWQARAAAGVPSQPPYSPDMKVTPLSEFKENTWRFPSDWGPVNNRRRLVLQMTSPCKFPDGTEPALDPESDRVLLRQLKEAMVGSMLRRNVVAEGRSRIRYPRPTGMYAILCQFRPVFVALSRIGCRSLADVRPASLGEVLALFGDKEARQGLVARAFEDLLRLSQHGLISDGLRDHDFEVSSGGRPIIDTTGKIGWQPIEDAVVSKLIALSNAYIDAAPALADQIARLRTDPTARSEVLGWAMTNLPCGPQLSGYLGADQLESTLVGLIQAAAGNLISFHAGLRISELMSIKRGFIQNRNGGAELDPDRLVMEFTTFKTVAALRGERRRIGAHPRLVAVADVLDRIATLIAPNGEYLFLGFRDGEPYSTNRWNNHLKRFCALHEIDIDMSSHRWRKTVAALAVRVLTGAAVHLKELFGHDSIAMTARYIMASPFIRDELRDLSLDEYRKRGRTLLESLTALGGPGLGGRQGKQLEAKFRSLVEDTDLTEENLGKTLDEWVEEMLRQGIYAVPVMPGVFCTKPMAAMGACATSSGDRLADPARCSARCAFQVQQAHRRDLVTWTVRRIASHWPRWSDLEQVYWAGQCKDQITAWPELADHLGKEIEGWPALRRIIQQTEVQHA